MKNNSKTIFFATDFSAASEDAFREAVEMAKVRGEKMVIAHVIATPGLVGYGVGEVAEFTEARIREGCQEGLNALKTKAELAGVKATTTLLTGTPHDEIANAAEEEGADLIVLGTHGRTGVSKFVLGSVAARVMCEAPCPVLTVRGKAA